MKFFALLILVSIVSISFGQRKYDQFSEEDRVELLNQKVKKNRIDVSGFIQKDSLLRQPKFINTKKQKQLKFPLDTAKSFEIEIDVRLDGKKGVVQVWGAARIDIKDPSKDTEQDIVYQLDMWADGIYNILQRTYQKILIGIKGIKKINPVDPEVRKITIRKVNSEVEFFVNKNLILTILPPDPVNEIGLTIKNKGVQIEKVKICYLSNQ